MDEIDSNLINARINIKQSRSSLKNNTVYNEDNLYFMKNCDSLSVDTIYCDVLYGTGRNFGDYQDLDGEIITIRLFYLPRLIEMKRILKETGNIFIQCDWRISHWMRIMLDEIFGYCNFKNEIIWSYNSAPRKKDRLGNRHDTILWYSKTDAHYYNFDCSEIREPYSLSAPRGYAKEKYYNQFGKVSGDVWNINILGQNDKTERVGYQTQKPKSLLKKIIIPFTPIGGVVADYFCGSGTSLVVAKEHGFQYIGCDISAKAVGLSLYRLGLVQTIK